MKLFAATFFALSMILLPLNAYSQEEKDGEHKDGEKTSKKGHHGKRDHGARKKHGDGKAARVERLKIIFAHKHKALLEKYNAAEGEEKEKLAALIKKKWAAFMAHMKKRASKGDGERGAHGKRGRHGDGEKGAHGHVCHDAPSYWSSRPFEQPSS